MQCINNNAAGKFDRVDCSELRKGTEGKVGEAEALRRSGALAFKPKHQAFKTRHTKLIKNNSSHIQTNPKID